MIVLFLQMDHECAQGFAVPGKKGFYATSTSRSRYARRSCIFRQ